MQRRIALVAVDAQWRDPNGTFFSFSYGIEKLRASIMAVEDLADCEVRLLDLRSNDPEAFMAALEDFEPTLVGLSTYVWSLPIFAGLTQLLRQRWPSLAIVAGGPAARRSVLDLPQFHGLRDRLDAVVSAEGEQVIRELARHHVEPDWRKRVPGLLLPTRGLWRSTEPIDRPVIDDYPTPYQLDIAPLHKTGYIETFRGCPIHCAFCQWGEQKSDRVHGADYLASHLEGLARAQVPNVFFLDAAFNLSPRAFRALVAAEERVGVLANCVVHGHLYPTFLEEHHLEFFDRIHQVQASVGIQSFDEEVLSRLGRPFDTARFRRVLERMRGRLDFDIELILGLPGDNPDSFRRTIETSLELGDSVKAFKCLVLPDALLERAAELEIDYDPETFLIRSCQGWSEGDLQDTWEWLYGLAEQGERPILNDDWVGFANRGPSHEPADEPEVVREISVDRFAHLVADVASDWGLDAVRLEPKRDGGDGVYFELRAPGGAVVLEAIQAKPGDRYFAKRDGLAYSHRGHVDRDDSSGLRKIIDALHAETLGLLGPAAR